MNYENIMKEIYKTDEKIQILKNKMTAFQKNAEIESYIERSNILGKCYKDNNYYYKVIDLDIHNHYRCIVICFTIENFMLKETKWDLNYLQLNYDEAGIEICNKMIKELNCMEEISKEEFTEKYFKKVSHFLNIDTTLKEVRFRDIENFKRSDGNE